MGASTLLKTIGTQRNLHPSVPQKMCMTKPYSFGMLFWLTMFQEKKFMMRAVLIWIINGFSAYGMLSGWGTHGRLACLYCMENTKAFRLANGGKTSWFDWHRRFLPSDYAFRRNKNAFKKGELERDEPPRTLTPTQVWHRVGDLPKITKTSLPPPNVHGYGEWHHWTKGSIFRDLPY